MNYSDPPLVSIVICTYNGEKYLRQQIESVINQTYSNIEILVVDDASSDNTIGILKEYTHYSKVKIFLNNKNVGLNKNFSRGINLATGTFIAFCDQDDIWKINKIEELVAKIGGNQLIYHDSSFIDEFNAPLGKTFSDLHNFVSGACSKNLIYQNCVSGHAMLVRKNFVQGILPFPDGIYYDWYIAYCAAEICGIKFIHDILVNYRIHSASYTKQNPYVNLKERISLFKIFEVISSRNKGQSYKMLNNLKRLYEQKKGGNSLPLIAFLLKNYNVFFYIRKRSFFSKFKQIINEAYLA